MTTLRTYLVARVICWLTSVFPTNCWLHESRTSIWLTIPEELHNTGTQVFFKWVREWTLCNYMLLASRSIYQISLSLTELQSRPLMTQVFYIPWRIFWDTYEAEGRLSLKQSLFHLLSCFSRSLPSENNPPPVPVSEEPWVWPQKVGIHPLVMIGNDFSHVFQVRWGRKTCIFTTVSQGPWSWWRECMS